MGRATELLARGVSLASNPGALSQPASLLACFGRVGPSWATLTRLVLSCAGTLYLAAAVAGASAVATRAIARKSVRALLRLASCPCAVSTRPRMSRCLLNCLVLQAAREAAKRDAAQRALDKAQEHNTNLSNRRTQLPRRQLLYWPVVRSLSNSARLKFCAPCSPLAFCGSALGCLLRTAACHWLSSSRKPCLTSSARALQGGRAGCGAGQHASSCQRCSHPAP